MKNKKLNKKLVAGVLATTIALGSASLPVSAVGSRNVQIPRLLKLSRVGAVAPKLNIQQFELVLDAGVKNGTFSKSEVATLKNKLGCGLVSRGVLRGLISAMTIKEKASLTAVQGNIETMATNAVKDTYDAVSPETANEAATKALVMADIIDLAGDAVSVATQFAAAQAAANAARDAAHAAAHAAVASAAVEAAVAATRIAKVIIARAANGDEAAQTKAEAAAAEAAGKAAAHAGKAANAAQAVEAAIAAQDAAKAAGNKKYDDALQNITTALELMNQAVEKVKEYSQEWEAAAEQIEKDAKKAFSANRTLLTLYKLDYQKAKIKVDILTLLQIMLGFKVEDERVPH